MGLEIFDGLLSKVETFSDEFGTLKQILDLNKEGKFIILCPNHLKPDSKIRENIALADDYGVLKYQLAQRGLENLSIVLRGDTDIEINSALSRTFYELHRKIASSLAKLLTKSYTTNLNIADNKSVRHSNLGNIKNIIEGMKNTNMVLYPFGNRFLSGEQDFEPESAYDVAENRLFDISKDGSEKWHKGIKKGFAHFAKLSGNPIIPVYVAKNEGKWSIALGKMIEVNIQTRQDYLRVIDEYLGQMRYLKDSLSKKHPLD